MDYYIGDAHVPPHTTKTTTDNLPDSMASMPLGVSVYSELFADAQYDFLQEKASYIKDPTLFLEHHLLKVTNCPRRAEGEKLSQSFPQDNQYCYDERLGQTVRIQCREYAKAYHDQMRGMVEDRMKGSHSSHRISLVYSMGQCRSAGFIATVIDITFSNRKKKG